MNSLAPQDRAHLQQAQRWLKLDRPWEATAELEMIWPPFRGHPEVSRVRGQIFAQLGPWRKWLEEAQAMTAREPDNLVGWLNYAAALRFLGRIEQTYKVLKSLVKQFQDYAAIPYELARYSCQRGDIPGARNWITVALSIAGNRSLKTVAMQDPDLQPLWQNGQTEDYVSQELPQHRE